MEKKPRVSVIIPAFNESWNIARLISSINRQTYKSIEIIVVDDGSSDNTVNIARKNQAKVYKRPHAERSVQRNFGVSKSKGSLVFIIDADMEFTPRVVEDVVDKMARNNWGGLTIPERTVGDSLLAKVRRFEREMYMNEPEIEVPRVFKRSVFLEFGGYDKNLTGPEDYDLPFRISKKYKIGRSRKYILHHEEKLSLWNLLRKKYRYAEGGASYASKHPRLVVVQGTILFRKIYLKHWKKFVRHPLTGMAFIAVRFLETCFAVCGFISSVGFMGFVKTFIGMFRIKK